MAKIFRYRIIGSSLLDLCGRICCASNLNESTLVNTFSVKLGYLALPPSCKHKLAWRNNQRMKSRVQV